QPISPDVGEMTDVGILQLKKMDSLIRRVIRASSQEAIHPEAAFVRAVIIKKVPGLRDRRDAADQVQVGSAEELSIVGQGGGLHVLPPGSGEACVDRRGQGSDVLVSRMQGGRQRQEE